MIRAPLALLATLLACGASWGAAAVTGDAAVHCSVAFPVGRASCRLDGAETDLLRLPTSGGDGATLTVAWTPVDENATVLLVRVIASDDRSHVAAGASPLVLRLPEAPEGHGEVAVTVHACNGLQPYGACPLHPVRVVRDQPYTYAWTG